MLRKRILTNTAFNAAGKAATALLQLGLVSLLIVHLGKENYGIVVLALALIGNTNLLEAGFGLSITKYIAEYMTYNDRTKVSSLIRTNFTVSTLLAVIFTIIIFLVNTFFLGIIFKIPPDKLVEAKHLIQILYPLIFLEIWVVSLIRVAEGLQNYLLARLAEVIKWSLRFLFILLVLQRSMGMKAVGGAYVVATLISFLLIFTLILVKNSWVQMRGSFFDKESFKLLWDMSLQILLFKFLGFFSYRIDTIVLGIFLTPVYIAYYNVAYKIYEVLRSGLALVSSTLVPVSSQLQAEQDNQRLTQLFLKSTKFSLALTYPAAIFLCFFSPVLLQWWVGPGFESSVLLIRLLMGSLMFVALISSGAEIITGLNQIVRLRKHAIISTGINFVLSLTLVQLIGVSGVVTGTLVGSIWLAGGYFSQLRSLFSINIKDFTKSTLIFPIISAVIMTGIYLSTKNFVAGVVTLAVCYGVFLYQSKGDVFKKFAPSNISLR